MAKRYAAVLLSLFLPMIAFAAPQNIQQLATWAVGILNSATAMLITVALVVYFGGIATNMFKLSEGDRERFREFLLWGIIAIFVMVSIWGIVQLLQNTLLQGSGASSSDAPVALLAASSA